MASLNKVMIIGNVGRDPEIRSTNDGKSIASLTVATSESWNDKSGNKQENTEWHRIVVFGKLADVIRQYVSKGDPIYFEGRLQTRSWTDKDGSTKYTTEIIADKMQMLGSAKKAANNNTANQRTQAPFNDEIPF